MLYILKAMNRTKTDHEFRRSFLSVKPLGWGLDFDVDLDL